MPKNPKFPTQLLTPKGVFAEYGIPVQTLANWRTQRIGPDFIKPAGRIYYVRSEIEEFIERNRVLCNVYR